MVKEIIPPRDPGKHAAHARAGLVERYSAACDRPAGIADVCDSVFHGGNHALGLVR